MIRAHQRGFWFCSLSIGLIGAALGGAAPPDGAPAPEALTAARVGAFGGEKAVTRPSRDAVMGFSIATRVTEIMVQGGQDVKQGQMMMRGDDAEDAVVVRLQKLRADSTLNVDKAEKAAALAKLEYDLLKEAQSKTAAVDFQVERARVSSEAAVIDVGITKINQDQEVMTLERAQARLDRLHMRAPFDGQVDQVLVDPGQSVSEQDKCLRVVRVDPLWIDVPVPTALSYLGRLKTGDPAWVLMDPGGDPGVHRGKVIEVSPTADAASGTRRIRVEIPNPRRIVAGLTCWVRFEAPSGEWAAASGGGA